MNQLGNRGQNPPQSKGILKKNPRPAASTPCASGASTADKLRALMEQFSPSPEPRSVRPRDIPARAKSVPRTPEPERKAAHTESLNSSDLDEVAFESENRILEPVPTISKCSACWKPLGEFEGCILRNCQQHIVCKSCLCHGVKDAEEMDKKPTCPVDTCRALIRRDELEAIRNEDQTEGTNRDSDASQKDDKRPTSSDFDQSEEIASSEEILLPREHDTMIVAAAGRCDKCDKLVDKNEYLDLRKCKKKHKICFDCILATVRVSKNLVRCPLYRECKSMMARDEVVHAKYEMKDAENQQKNSVPKSRAKPKKYIYPNGLPSRDLWPVLSSTTCNKCGRDIDVLNGIVIKQCNVHCVCVKCVREKIALNRNLVECPMYISCKSMMTEDEVEAFIERFGGPTGLTQARRPKA